MFYVSLKVHPGMILVNNQLDAQFIHVCLFLFSTCLAGTAVAQWLRFCAINRKVAGSIPDGVTGIFPSHNPSDRTMALGSTQPLTEMSTRSTSWG